MSHANVGAQYIQVGSSVAASSGRPWPKLRGWNRFGQD